MPQGWDSLVSVIHIPANFISARFIVPISNAFWISLIDPFFDHTSVPLMYPWYCPSNCCKCLCSRHSQPMEIFFNRSPSFLNSYCKRILFCFIQVDFFPAWVLVDIIPLHHGNASNLTSDNFSYTFNWFSVILLVPYLIYLPREYHVNFKYRYWRPFFAYPIVTTKI